MIATLALSFRRAVRQHRVWFALMLALGVWLPVAVEAMPGLELSEESLHRTRTRTRARVARTAPLSSRVASLDRLESMRLTRRPMLEQSTRHIVCSDVRKVPATACDSPGAPADH